MGTVKEEFELLKAKILAGKENEVVHVVWTDQDRKRKKTTKSQTRFTIDCGTPEIFRDLYTEYDRILTQIGNKTMCLSIIVDWLRALTEARIAKKLAEGQEEKPGGPPRAEIPKWVDP